MLNKFKLGSFFKRSFSAYYKQGDISTDLLLTLSMQQSDKKYSSHHELVESLVKRNLIKTETIINSMKALDRKYFFENVGVQKEGYYFDKPYDIGHGEKISAPMMHAIAAEALYHPVKSLLQSGPVNFIDVGTGSGYVATLMYHIFAKEVHHHQETRLFIHGLDLFDLFMRNTNLVLASLLDKRILSVNKAIDIQFQKRCFFDYLNSNTLEGYQSKIINIGAAIDQNTYDNLKTQVEKSNGAIMAPVIQNDGEQNLMYFSKTGNKIEEDVVMKVIYSPMKPFVQVQKTNDEINKYFINDPKDAESEDDSESPNPRVEQEAQTENKEEDKGIMLAKIEKEVKSLEEKIKKWHIDFAKSGKKVALAEIQAHPEMKDILALLNKKKRHVNILKGTLSKN